MNITIILVDIDSRMAWPSGLRDRKDHDEHIILPRAAVLCNDALRRATPRRGSALVGMALASGCGNVRGVGLVYVAT